MTNRRAFLTRLGTGIAGFAVAPSILYGRDVVRALQPTLGTVLPSQRLPDPLIARLGHEPPYATRRVALIWPAWLGAGVIFCGLEFTDARGHIEWIDDPYAQTELAEAIRGGKDYTLSTHPRKTMAEITREAERAGFQVFF